MIQTLASPENQHIKLAASLRQKKHREATGLFAVEGVRFALEAADSDWQIQFAIASEAAVAAGPGRDLAERLDRKGCAVYIVSPALYAKVSETETPQGITLVLRQQLKTLDIIEQGSAAGVWVVLDSLQDPGNVGTLVRTADAAGAAGVILAGACADIYAGKTARATMGSLFHLPVIKASADDCRDFFRYWQLPVYVAGAEAATSYTEADLSGAFAVVFGNEGAGVGAEFRSQAAGALRIPLLGRAESLNVASAAAVILFEAARQRMLR